jgi:large repetitive protein
MRAANVERALWVLAGILVSACGEEPTSASAGLSNTDRDSQGLSSIQHALTCPEGDYAAPELSITDQDIFYECTGAGNGNAWQAPEVTAVDACEGPIPVHGYNTGDDDKDGVPGMIDPDDFGPGPTTETEGLYYVQYLAWDTSYNIQGAILSVYVQDTLKPVLTLNGDAFVQTQCFSPTDDPSNPDGSPTVDPDPYVDQGATAHDQCYGDLTPYVQTFGEINKQVPGVYSLEYQVRDNAFNWAEPITRTVEVVDTLSPVLRQSPPIRLWPGNNQMRRVHLNECAQAWDMCEGPMDLSSRAYNLSVTSNNPQHDAEDIVILDNSTFEVRARHNTHGASRIYTARYNVADSSGNVREGTCTLYVPQNPNDPAPEQFVEEQPRGSAL